MKRRFLQRRIRGEKMKGSGLTEDRRKARRAGLRRETSHLNSKQGNQVEAGGRKGEAGSCIHDLEVLVEEVVYS